MKLADFEKISTTVPNGIQVVLDFDKYHLSIVQSDFSYGGTRGLYEIGVFAAQDGVASDMVKLPGITAEYDTIKGFLTEADVDAIIKKMYTITKKDPVQV
jgi:hypothetical protein